MDGLVALEISISLVFIFLIYSLLASTLTEMWTSSFGYRARNLRNTIKRMLSDRKDTTFSTWIGDLLLSFLPVEYFRELFRKKQDHNSLTDRFYHHPAIKYLGKNAHFSKPSYIKPETFSEVLLDVLEDLKEEQESDSIGDLFISESQILNNLFEEIKSFEKTLELASDHINEDYVHEVEAKINGLLAQLDKNELDRDEIDALRTLLNEDLSRIIGETPETAAEKLGMSLSKAADKLSAELEPFGSSVTSRKSIISEGTGKQLLLHWKKSSGDLEKFKANLGDWFDEMGERSTGWYKRKIRTITFVVGLFIAVAFNVNTIEITKRLSTDKEALKGIIALIESNTLQPDTVVNQADLDALKARLDSLQNIEKQVTEVLSIEEKLPKGDQSEWLAAMKGEYPFWYRFFSFICLDFEREQYLGWLITALALSFGSEFWFDLLNKLMRLRSSVKMTAALQRTSTSGKSGTKAIKEPAG